MKKIFFFLMMAGSLAACNNAADSNEAASTTAPAATTEAAATPSFTSIQWIDSVKNFGRIKEGEKIILSFRFKNTGDKPLVIETVNPGCGCTVADRPEAPIAPGAEGEIKAEFDSNGRPGAAYKTMDVTCNTAQSRYTLVFEGEVIPKK